MKKILYLLPLLLVIFACGAQPAPTQDVSNMVNATLTAVAQNNPQPLATQVAPPTQAIATLEPATLSAPSATNGNQSTSVQIQQIEMQQGSRACTTDSIYMVSAKINGGANTEVSYTVSSGNNGSAGPDAGTTTIMLDNTGGYDVHTGLSGPFSDPGNVQITITVFVNGQAVNNVHAVICQGGQYTTAASDGGASGGQNPSVKIQQIEMQQGTQACTASAGYIISAKITGAANAQVSYTISSGNNGAIFAPDAAGTTIMLDNTGGYDVNFGIQGPFSDPGNVKITVFVNGQAVNYAYAVICQGGEYQYKQ